VVLAVLDVEDELADEGLVVLLPDRLVALGEVLALLDVQPSSAAMSLFVSSRPRKPDFWMPSLRKFIAS
jgi:hypothetical protein